MVDSSIVAKWFITEDDSGIAFKIRDEFATGRVKLSVPALLFYEVMNALKYSGAFNEKDLAIASSSLSRYDFEVWQPRGKILEESVRTASKKNLTIYDACYVALAIRKRTKLVTEDREILSKFPDAAISLQEFDSTFEPIR